MLILLLALCMIHDPSLSAQVLGIYPRAWAPYIALYYTKVLPCISNQTWYVWNNLIIYSTSIYKYTYSKVVNNNDAAGKIVKIRLFQQFSPNKKWMRQLLRHLVSKQLRLLHGRVGDSTTLINSLSPQMSELVEDAVASWCGDIVGHFWLIRNERKIYRAQILIFQF